MTETAQIDLLTQRLHVLVSAAEYLTKPTFFNQLAHRHEQAVIRSNSPWLTRADAAAYWGCSVAEVDAASRNGILTKYMRVGTPMFLKTEGDEAIKSGKWTKTK